MKLDVLYEKLNSMIALGILEYGDTQKILEFEYQPEYMYLNNMTLDKFKGEDNTTKFNILRVYDVYFRAGKPMITDAKYDALYKVYESINGVENTTPIMFEPSLDGWEKVEHEIPMGSLDKQTTIEEIEKWNKKPNIQGKEILVSEKLDGISLEVIYKKGKFVQAVTRGDGKKGDDITENAKYFDGMIKTLNECWDCAIRGEVMITKENLKAINAILVESGKEPLKNTRNGVAGMATKYKDRNEEILSLITFIAYDVQVFAAYDTGENVA